MYSWYKREFKQNMIYGLINIPTSLKTKQKLVQRFKFNLHF